MLFANSSLVDCILLRKIQNKLQIITHTDEMYNNNSYVNVYSIRIQMHYPHNSSPHTSQPLLTQVCNDGAPQQGDRVLEVRAHVHARPVEGAQLPLDAVGVLWLVHGVQTGPHLRQSCKGRGVVVRETR